jgi:hypothetical protein
VVHALIVRLEKEYSDTTSSTMKNSPPIYIPPGWHGVSEEPFAGRTRTAEDYYSGCAEYYFWGCGRCFADFYSGCV